VEEDYLKPYDAEELKEFYASAGVQIGEEEFEAAFETACEAEAYTRSHFRST
jgi:hypothetical protein